ncbi:stable plasmid inheritance protein A [Klebsiella sp. WP7-S18-CRE-02]|uniref:StbA family protein n=2 Tax=Enterobacterales TaxID=91347 RepID=A0A2T2Y592_9ENTR|nr:StbA family protein [Kluyvera genomosp. 2]BBQ81602.1 stable plasmid inheritance protein A [Klebsiella sp. WP3-W18-ESBL-02]BBR18650.1 stable plasmid inheritance protein A [Klebsiella sp. WP3-S18-ESBL-05]BBS89516.1 stable plasmid inheritance protein A [Klebsiella sp. WP7-S18-CRE-02]BBS94538.1 stable plasmid inheritance protein A [Klebsiella sp. WP7-S18-CRE-03]BBS99568.1 stable plasmid inheritance protein A [Klebsiella sp. WP7-S18-ESBL-04]BBT68830.1 stable plasmid inheritance protein A [Klebs
MTRMKFAIDDGSTNVKISWIENGTLKTVVSPNSFRKDWKSAALLRGQAVYNYTIGTTKYTYDATSDKALSTTHIDYQYDDLNLLAVHHALLLTGMTPCDVEVIVTLPITQYYNPDDCQRNESRIEAKRRNLMRDIALNKGELFRIVDVQVMPESLPAALSHLLNSNVTEFTKSLVIDCGGTTLDMGVIVGEFDDVSAIYGNNEIGVAMVTDATRKLLAAADSDSSYLVANELIKRRHDDEFVKSVINDESRIADILERIEIKIQELGDQVAYEAKKFAKNPNRVYLVGGGAHLIESAVRETYATLGDRVITIDAPQSALSREICLYHADTSVETVAAPHMAEVGDDE